MLDIPVVLWIMMPCPFDPWVLLRDAKAVPVPVDYNRETVVKVHFSKDSAEGFGLRPRLFFPLGQKKNFLCCFGPFLAIIGVQ